MRHPRVLFWEIWNNPTTRLPDQQYYLSGPIFLEVAIVYCSVDHAADFDEMIF
jgi:hypothetical protein